MKKLFFAAAVVAISLSSCSNDDVIELKQDEIKFSVVTDRASRAADVYCNNNLPNDFKVWAYWEHEGQKMMYIDGDVVTKGENGYASSETRYWPSTGYPLTFIALKNTRDIALEGNSISHDQRGISADPDVTKQVDVLYAVANNQIKTDATDGVKLNFRHALSQIVFNAKNTNSKLYIDVQGVKVGNVCNTAQISTFPTSTSVNYENHDGTVTEEDLDGQITWVGANGEHDLEAFSVEFADIFAFENISLQTGKLTQLTSVNHSRFPDEVSDKEFTNTAMLLIPQHRAAWDPTTVKTPTNPQNKNAYIAIKCNIWNVSGTTFDSDKDILLHEGWAYIPVELNWKGGKKYTYTFIFGNGNGGYDENGDPVLTPITYNLTVDDFQAVEEIEEEMKTKE